MEYEKFDHCNLYVWRECGFGRYDGRFFFWAPSPALLYRLLDFIAAPPLPLINVQGRGKNVQETKGSPLLFKKNKKITIREGTISSETGI